MTLFALVAAVLINFSMGSLYGWSVLVAPFEESLEASRASISAVYSVALFCYTVGAFIAYRVMAMASLAPVTFAIFLLAAAGLAIAGALESYVALLVGYGIVFAIPGGVSYFIAMTAASVDMPVRRSVAIGMNMAAFAGGGLVWPRLFVFAIDWQGPHVTLLVFAGYLAAIGVVIGLLLMVSGAKVPGGADESGIFKDILTDRPRIIILLWFSFVFVAFSALMSMGHAAGMVTAYGIDAAYLGPMVTNLGYVGGALCGGVLADLLTGRRVIIVIAATAAIALFLLFGVPVAAMSLVTLALVGASFGATASVYPVTIAGYYGLAAVPRVYGRVATAYGTAGLLGPWIAGALFDSAGDYAWAVLVAGGMAVAGILTAWSLPHMRPASATA